MYLCRDEIYIIAVLKILLKMNLQVNDKERFENRFHITPFNKKS